MINEDALFEVIDAAITAANLGEFPLTNAVAFSTTRGNISEQEKTIRIDAWNGILTPQTSSELKEQNGDFVVQCLAKTQDVGLAAEQAAQIIADEIGKDVFQLLINNPTLNGVVCDIDFFSKEINYERAIIDIGANKYGAFYLYGTINPI